MAANITRDYFLALFDEFTTVPTPKIDAYIDIATLRVPRGIWEEKTPYATALLAAHLIASTGGIGGSGGAAGGPITSESVGDLSRSYSSVGSVAGGGSQNSGDQEMSTTRYGQEFISLRRETVVPGFALGMSVFSG